MGQIISDVTDVLNYQNNKKANKETKKQILSDIAQSE